MQDDTVLQKRLAKQITRWAMYVSRDIVERSYNHCCRGNATARSLVLLSNVAPFITI